MGSELERFFFFFLRETDPSRKDSSRLEQEKYWSKSPNALVQGYSKAGDDNSMGMVWWESLFPAWNNEHCAVQKIPKKAKNGERKELPPNP